MSITIGMTGRLDTVVDASNTAAALGSGLVPVFATPSMVALMEGAAAAAVAPALDAGQGTVGTHLNLSHDAATPVGLKVWAEAEVTAVEGKCIRFTITAYDEVGPIGRGTHERFVIQLDRFLAKAEQRKP